MRPIKFRAWDGRQIQYDIAVARGKATVNYEDDGPCEEDGCPIGDLVHEHHSWPLMQFTGLHDKNGKEIYEGDVLEYEDEGMITDSGVYRVGWDNYNAGWGLQDNHDDEYSATVAGEVMLLSEVIGNIYENPGLLQ